MDDALHSPATRENTLQQPHTRNPICSAGNVNNKDKLDQLNMRFCQNRKKKTF